MTTDQLASTLSPEAVAAAEESGFGEIEALVPIGQRRDPFSETLGVEGGGLGTRTGVVVTIPGSQ
jgi:hypothetical protein